MTDCHGESGCITCGDVAVEMTMLTVDELQRLAMCAAADGTEETVEVELVGAVAPGDELLVHAGTALQRLSTA